ncbi:stage II sporulation protein D [Bacillus sp. T3]|uniref:stage II sporulation protein D n=1 Tax=Bacillus sp. T3 TaxID=467262 RepID=UPI0029810D32|nr:stage II sporulation protein D [Bacillus sp. T3]
MTKVKVYIVGTALLIAITLLVPTLLVLPFKGDEASGMLGEKLTKGKTETPTQQATSQPQQPTTDLGVEVAVYRTASQAMEKLPLEDYVVGVVAAEMPADFEMEALKAQALTARTYIVKQMVSQNHVGLPEGADTADTELHQVYKNETELRSLWKTDYSWKIKKIKEAVQQTAGQILTFNGEPITATFFSTSNGYTENSEDYWSNSFPYLRSVESPWDKNSPKYSDQKIFTIQDFENKLGVKLASQKSVGTITKRTAGQRVAKVNINGKVLTGKEIREKLGLKSSDFTWTVKGNNVVITTKGYGHGVGMSQYGANGMAQSGKNYQDIVKHYYKGVEVVASDTMLAQITAKK